MNAAAHSARAMVLALQYFTRVPIPSRLAHWAGFDTGLQKASLAHFPGVGLVVGAAAFAAYALAVMLLPATLFTHFVAAVTAAGIAALLTGALHEDGLADTVDGLCAGSGRERALEVMKDSRVGGQGALALLLAVLGRAFLLGSIGAAGGLAAAAAALLGGHALSRGFALVIVASLPHAGRAGSSKSLPVAQPLERGGAAIALAWCAAALLVVTVLASAAAAAFAIAAAAITMTWMRRLLARRLGGFTGDGLGATQQACEIAYLLGAASVTLT